MKPTPINEMTPEQLKIAIWATESSMNCKLMGRADTLPLDMVIEFWENLQRQAKELEKLQSWLITTDHSSQQHHHHQHEQHHHTIPS